MDDIGRADFDTLQTRARRRRWYPDAPPVVYAVFDLLVRAGEDITQQPLLARKASWSTCSPTARPGGFWS